MNLITQIPAGAVGAGTCGSNTNGRTVPGLSRSNSVKGATNGSKGGLSRSPSKREKRVDAEGWQTVGKRR